MSLAWIRWSVWLYVVAGAAWLPVVWIQYRMRDLAHEAAVADTALSPRFHRFFAWCIALGCVAFPALVTITLPGEQPLPSAHGHASAIEEAVRERCPSLADVIVHTEPMGAEAT